MARPHEDRQRHTLVDHRPGGPSVAFELGAWFAIDVAAVKAERATAAVAAYETLVELFQASEVRAKAVVFRSVDDRRVISLLEVDGHAAFRRLTAAWDDHHLYAEHRAKAEGATLELFRVVEGAGDVRVDTASADRYNVERVARRASNVAGLLGPLALAPGYRGTIIFGSEDETTTIVLSRFEHQTEYDAFRETALASTFLGPIGATGESHVSARAVKTFGTHD